MKPPHDQSFDARTWSAIDELQHMISARYPASTFKISRGEDDPLAVHLIAIVDLDDPGEVLDLVIDRVVALQVDEGIPLHVIPEITPARVGTQVLARERHSEGQDASVAGESQPVAH